MASKPLIVANWKMNPATFREARELFGAEKKIAESARGVSIVLAPPAIYLRELSARYKGKRVSLCIQNAHFDGSGAHTGEISFTQARDARALFALIGHAERRALGESDDDVRKKVSAAVTRGMTAILCVGEIKRADGGEHFLYVREQIKRALSEFPQAKLSRIVVAYEPVWTIGKDMAMSTHDMREMSIFIRKCLFELFGAPGMNVRVLYGGSIDSTSAPQMLQDGGVQGLLVGRASADAGKFGALISSLA